MASQAVQVELVATFGQFQAQLQQAADSMRKMAQQMGGSLAPVGQSARTVGEDADKGFGKFKEGVARSREQAMYFAQALGELGPTGKTAQIALAGVGSVLLGGGVVGIGLSLAQAGVRLLSDAWTENADKARKAAEASKKAADEIAKRIEEARARVQAATFRLSGTSEAEQFRQTKLKEAADALADLEAEVLGSGSELAKAKRAGNLSLAEAWSKRLEEAKAKLPGLRELANQATREYDRLLGMEALGGLKEQDKKDEQAIDSASGQMQAIDEWKTYQLEKAKAADDAVRARIEFELRMEQAAAEERGRTMLAEQAADQHRAERLKRHAEDIATAYAKTAQAIGESVGQAFAEMVTGAKTVGQAMAGMLKSIVSMVIDSVKAQIMANAAAAAAEAAKSQAGIPVVGPILAGGAMVAMLSLVQGLVNQIPSAAGGWERVPRDTMAMIHKDEQVLPAEYAEGLRNLVAGGGRGGDTFNIVAMDTKSFEQYLLANAGAVAKAWGRAARDGRRFG